MVLPLPLPVLTMTNPLRPERPRARASACSWRLRARPSSLNSSISPWEEGAVGLGIEKSSAILVSSANKKRIGLNRADFTGGKLASTDKRHDLKLTAFLQESLVQFTALYNNTVQLHHYS